LVSVRRARGPEVGRELFGRAIPIGSTLLVGFLALYPLGWLVYGSFYSAAPLQPGGLTLSNYGTAFGDPKLAAMLLRTAYFAVGQMLVAVTIGTLLGWIVVRTNTPGRRVFEFLILVLFLVPTILAVVAWTMLLSPSRGLINILLVDLLRLSESPFNIYSVGGMIFVQGLYLAPLAYLIITPAFTAIDASLEESARLCGSGPARVFARITLPLTRPSILAACLLLFVFGLESFEIPQMLGGQRGLYTYTTLIYNVIAEVFPADYGKASALSMFLLLVAGLCMYFYRRVTAQQARFETLRGKGYRAGQVDLGRWRWVTFAGCVLFFFIAVALPLIILAIGSLLQYYGRFDWSIFARMSTVNYPRVLEHPQILKGLFNSLSLAVVGGALCVLLSAVFSYVIVKGRWTGRGWLDGLAMLPIAVPATVLGVGLLWAWITVPLPVYGTTLILAVAFITRYLPLCLRTVSGGLIQLSSELEEASKMSGAAWLYTARRIILPLLRPAMAAAWLMMFMIIMRELSMSILLAGPGNQVVSVVMYDYYTSGELGLLSAASILFAAIVMAVVLLARFGFRVNFSAMRTG